MPDASAAGWLAKGLVVVLGEFDAQDGPDVTLSHNGDRVAVAARALSYPPANGDGDGERRTIVVASVPGHDGPEASTMLLVKSAGRSLELDLAQLGHSDAGLVELVLHWLAPLDAATRNTVLDFLATSAMAHPSEEASDTLFRLRQALRERLPVYKTERGNKRGLTIERITAVDDRSVYIEGWLRDVEAEVVRLTVVSPEGARVEIGERAFRYTRPDVTAFFASSGDRSPEKNGFICFVELAAPTLLPEGWIVEMENAQGDALEVNGPTVARNILAARDVILADPARERLPVEELMASHVQPAITRIQNQIEAWARVDQIEEFGDPPVAPEVSIVVPLYQRIDLVEQQLAEFTQDPELREAELIYVLDSPEQGIYLVDLVSRLYPIYKVPMRIAILEQNVGFALANNAGASLARGRLLLLMNSDILPAAPGWLGRMQEFYDSKPQMGALGVKLLYEDESIQHAGMYFHQPTGTNLWLDAHYFKGLHRDFPAANVTRAVPGVSGACMMIDAALYEELGGLGGKYVQGDYEDFDLCLRLAEMGRESWYYPEVELYHLEALSYTGSLRVPANRYNMWLHTHLWRHRIEELMAEQRTSGARESRL
jgi:GT2 family glycosyltransferase